MKIMPIAAILNHAFQFVIQTSEKYHIDESHGLKHSMDVLHLANKIYNHELETRPFLINQKEIIFTACILHDMCDSKYNLEIDGLVEINKHMKTHMSEENLKIVSQIISTMSYSKVKKNGFPDLQEYQLAYHIVREADLLSAYDIDRCIIYGMMVEKYDYSHALRRAKDLMRTRVLNYRSDNLFITNYSKILSLKMHVKSVYDLEKLDFIHSTFEKGGAKDCVNRDL